MNDGNESAWSVFWWLLFIVTLTVGLPGAVQENGAAGGWAVAVFLAFEALMLALPSLWQGWQAGRPARERRRVEARERSAVRARQRQEADETRRQRRAERQRNRVARAEAVTARRDTLAARQEAEAYYRAHAALLGDVLPAALFRAEVEATLPAGAGPEAAWQAARDLIGRMQPLVRQEQERRRQEQERQARLAEQVRDIDTQIRAAEARIRALRATGPDADFAEDEVAAERELIEQLRERRAALQQTR